jgi:5-methylcytosine-specific restriction endonuclease McrA
MAQKTQALRRQALRQQGGCCFYCQQPIWEENPSKFSDDHSIPTRFLKWVRNTAEHIRACCDGGKDRQGNVVAACYWCNSRRHQGRQHRAPDSAAYRDWVQGKVGSGKWHPLVQHRGSSAISKIERKVR